MTAKMSDLVEFDQYAVDYDNALAEGISVTGEDKDYFAQGRIAWLARCLKKLRANAQSVMDFGCGIGSATPHLLNLLEAGSVLGVDVSPNSLDVAEKTWGSEQARFLLLEQYQPEGRLDLVFCNGVFHHIPIAERAAAVGVIYRSLRPGGFFAFWENNPWNPGTRYIMSRCPFDRDAVTLTPLEARRLLHAAGFSIISTDFLFIFPRALSWLRGIEPLVSKLPLGGQYQALCRKPER